MSTRTPSKFSSVAFLAGLAADHYLGMSGAEYSEEEALDLLARKRQTRADLVTLKRIASPDHNRVHPTNSIEWMDLMGAPIEMVKNEPEKSSSPPIISPKIKQNRATRARPRVRPTPPPPNFWMRFLRERDYHREMLAG